MCLQWTLYQVVTNRPKSRFSADKKVGFLIKIETWINQNSVVTGIWTDPEKDKSLAVLFSEQSLVEKRYFNKIAVLYQGAGKRPQPIFPQCLLYVSSWFNIMPAPRRSSFFFKWFAKIAIFEFYFKHVKSSVGYENLHSNSPSHNKQTLKISWKSTGWFFQNKLLKKAIFPKNECYGRDDHDDHDEVVYKIPYRRARAWPSGL